MTVHGCIGIPCTICENAKGREVSEGQNVLAPRLSRDPRIAYEHHGPNVLCWFRITASPIVEIQFCPNKEMANGAPLWRPYNDSAIAVELAQLFLRQQFLTKTHEETIEVQQKTISSLERESKALQTNLEATTALLEELRVSLDAHSKKPRTKPRKS